MSNTMIPSTQVELLHEQDTLLANARLLDKEHLYRQSIEAFCVLHQNYDEQINIALEFIHDVRDIMTSMIAFPTASVYELFLIIGVSLIRITRELNTKITNYRESLKQTMMLYDTLLDAYKERNQTSSEQMMLDIFNNAQISHGELEQNCLEFAEWLFGHLTHFNRMFDPNNSAAHNDHILQDISLENFEIYRNITR